MLSFKSQGFSQKSIGIGTSNPEKSSIIELKSDTAGLLLPAYNRKLNTATNQVEPLKSGLNDADIGLIFYNNYTEDIMHFSGSEFQPINGIPKGGIAIWSGALSTIPTGWKVCDGTQNTPDLRSRFMVGYNGSNYKINGKGGSNTLTLSVNQMPEHSHTLNDPGHVHSGSISHSHYLKYLKMMHLSSGKKSNPGGAGDGISNLTSNTVNLKPSVDVSSSKVINSVSSVGIGKAIENKPPYYVVIFIMKE